MKKSIKENWVYISILLLGGWVNNYWVITIHNGFLMDDYTWLKLVQFNPVKEIFSLLPNMPYNDRPVGAVFIKILHHFWGLNSFFYHRTLLCLHLFNTFMVFAVLKKGLIRLEKENAAVIALTAALIFGMWPNSTMAVQWVAAIFDLLGGTLCLLSMALFLDATDPEKEPQKVFNVLFCLVFYYLALRTKEMAIVLPVVFLLFHGLCHLERGDGTFKQLLSYRPPRFVFSHLFLMVFYFLWIMKLKSGTANVTISVDSPYYYVFDPGVILTSFARYLAVFFQFDNLSFSFNGFTPFPLACMGFYFFLAGYSVFSIIRGRWGLSVLFLMVGVALAPVLPMANMQHRLYWYIPSIFMAALIAVVLNYGVKKLAKKHAGSVLLPILLVLAMFLLVFIPGVRDFRGYWSELCQKDRIAIQDIRKMPPPDDVSQIYVKRAPVYDVFFYGPGDINAILFNRPDLRTYLSLDAVQDIALPLYTMEAHPDGHVDFTGIKTYAELVLADPPSQMEIVEWGPCSVKSGEKFNQQPDGKSAVWFVGTHFTRHAVIVWNGKELVTFHDVKNFFIAASVPDSMYATPGNYTLSIKDTRTGQQSKPLTFKVLP